MESCAELYLVESRPVVRPPKLNPNQLQALATKAKKDASAAAVAAAKKNRGNAAASSAAPAVQEKLTFPSRCHIRKFPGTFEEYREQLVDSLGY